MRTRWLFPLELVTTSSLAELRFLASTAPPGVDERLHGELAKSLIVPRNKLQ